MSVYISPQNVVSRIIVAMLVVVISTVEVHASEQMGFSFPNSYSFVPTGESFLAEEAHNSIGLWGEQVRGQNSPSSTAAPNASPWTWKVLPEGLIYSSYLAGPKESRLCGVWNYLRDHGWIWDATAGGRIGLLRYGSNDKVLPEGFQFDVEGAGMIRIDWEQEWEVMACDFRVGAPLTYGTKTTQYKLAYYHLSSHLGDEYMLRPGSRDRINYVRDSIVLGISHRPIRDLRLYAEAAWAFNTGERTEPWEFQFGVEYSPLYSPYSSVGTFYGSPFFAINAHLFEELDFGGNLTVQCGWQWRGANNHAFRAGIQYFTGSSEQFEFQDLYESKIGLGIWADF